VEYLARHGYSKITRSASRSRRLIACVVIIVCLGALVALAIRAAVLRERAERLDSPERSVALPSRLNWPVRSDDTCTWWLSATEVVIFEPSASGWRFCLYDVRLRKEFPLGGLTGAFKLSKGRSGWMIPSPDGRRLMWRVPALIPGWNSYAVTTISGATLRYWSTGQTWVKWSDDGTSWLA
jgi:hypothetical protein